MEQGACLGVNLFICHETSLYIYIYIYIYIYLMNYGEREGGNKPKM
jgi:hypothetical protein